MTSMPPQAMPPQPQQGGMNPNMMAFLQMLQKQGYPPQSNLQNSGSAPQQGPQQQPPRPGMPQQMLPQPQQMGAGNPMAQQGPVQNQQIPPQLLQMLQQRMQQGGQPPSAPQQGQRHTPQELAALGRMGDTTVAHLTPGEIEVPPQVQTPKVLATLKKAFEQKGAPPQNFVAGSPSSSVNPKTGMPEYNFWSSILPTLGGLLGGAAGTFVAPGVGTAIGAGLGSGAGGLAGGENLTTALGVGALTGLGDYGGSYLGGIVGGAGSPAAGSAGEAATQGAQDASGGLGQAAFPTGGNSSAMQAFLNPSDSSSAAFSPSIGPTMQNAGQGAAASGPGAQGALDYATSAKGIGGSLGSALGGALGNMIFNPANNQTQPQGFNTPYKPASQLPNWQTLIGQTGYTGPTPQFNGYNPATNYPAAYNFFPAGQQNSTQT